MKKSSLIVAIATTVLIAGCSETTNNPSAPEPVNATIPPDSVAVTPDPIVVVEPSVTPDPIVVVEPSVTPDPVVIVLPRIAAAGTDNSAATALFRQQSSGIDPDDCDAVGTGWICANFDNPRQNDITIGALPVAPTPTPTPEEPASVHVNNLSTLAGHAFYFQADDTGQHWTYVILTGREDYYVVEHDTYDNCYSERSTGNLSRVEGTNTWNFNEDGYYGFGYYEGYGTYSAYGFTVNPETLVITANEAYYNDHGPDNFYSYVYNSEDVLLRDLVPVCPWY